MNDVLHDLRVQARCRTILEPRENANDNGWYRRRWRCPDCRVPVIGPAVDGRPPRCLDCAAERMEQAAD